MIMVVIFGIAVLISLGVVIVGLNGKREEGKFLLTIGLVLLIFSLFFLVVATHFA